MPEVKGRRISLHNKIRYISAYFEKKKVSIFQMHISYIASLLTLLCSSAPCTTYKIEIKSYSLYTKKHAVIHAYKFSNMKPYYTARNLYLGELHISSHLVAISIHTIPWPVHTIITIHILGSLSDSFHIIESYCCLLFTSNKYTV